MAIKLDPRLRHITLRIDLGFPWMRGAPPEMIGRAVVIAVKAMPFVKLEVERSSLIGYVAIPEDTTLAVFAKRVEETRGEIERELAPKDWPKLLVLDDLHDPKSPDQKAGAPDPGV